MPLTLEQAITLALKQNRDLELARLSVTDSQFKKDEQRAAYFPHIRNESGILHITQLAGVQVPAGAFGEPATGPIPGHTLFLGQGASTSYTSGTGLEQPISQVFKIRAANRAATADVHTAQIEASEAEDTIALKVRQLYYGILVTQLKQQAAAGALLASHLKAQESADAVERGRALQVTLLQSQSQVLGSEQNILVQDLTLQEQVRALNDLLGLPIQTDLQLDPRIAIKQIEIPGRQQVVQQARDASPAVLSARQALMKARAGLTVARDAYIPDATGLARYSYQSGIPFLVHNFGTFGVNITYDLFDGGRRESALRDANTLVAQAESNLVNVQEKVSVQVEAAYDKVEELEQMVTVAEEAQQVSAEASRLADRQFEQSAALASTRADARAQLLSATASSMDARLGLILAQADLRRILGEIVR